MGKQFVTKDGYLIERCSRWIRLDYIYVTEKHRLFCYADTYGADENEKFFPVSVFRHDGKMYALNQFLRLDHPYMFDDETGKTAFLSGYDGEQYYKPFFIEMHHDGAEYIRLYKEVGRKDENGGFEIWGK